MNIKIFIMQKALAIDIHMYICTLVNSLRIKEILQSLRKSQYQLIYV